MKRLPEFFFFFFFFTYVSVLVFFLVYLRMRTQKILLHGGWKEGVKKFAQYFRIRRNP